MLTRLKVILREAFVQVEEIDDSSALRMACTILMFEILRADHETHEAEVAKISQHIRDAFELDARETQTLMRLAEEQSEQAVSLHEVVRTINNGYGPGEKCELLRMLWEVAYADGKLDRHEEYTIRKLADLLYVPHRDFVRTKHQAAPD